MKKILVTLFTLLLFSKLVGNDIAWSFPAVALSSASQNASNPQVAIDSNGNAAAVWVEGGLIRASVKPVSMGWGSATTISGANASSPRLISDGSGNLTAVWLEVSAVKAATKPFGGSWSASTTLSNNNASSPDLAIDPAGDAIAVWARNGNIESSVKLFGGNWQARTTILSSNASSPRVAIGGAGAGKTAVVVWSGVESSVNVVFSSSRLVPGLWSLQQQISDARHQAINGAVAVDGNGNAVAVWYAYDVLGSLYSGVDVQCAYKLFGGTWSSLKTLSKGGIRNPATLAARVKFDGLGNVIAVWNTSFNDEVFTVQSSVKPIRQDWTHAVNIGIPSLYAYAADLAVSSLGNALTVSTFFNGSALIIQSSELSFSGFVNNVWSLPLNISSNVDNEFPRVAATLTGTSAINAAAVWVSTNGSNNVIMATTGSRSLVAPPTVLAVVQSSTNFGGVFTEYFNTLSWVASSNPNVVGYVVLRNNMPLVQVGSSVLSIVDDNRVQNGSVTYGVIAVDNQGSQSAVATVSFP